MNETAISRSAGSLKELGYASSKIQRRYDYRPDLPDKRDFYFKYLRGAPLPDAIDLRTGMSRIEDQGQLGSCTANAWVGVIEYLDKIKDGHYKNWSRLFLYYNERALHGEENQDNGAYIRDGAKALAKLGICRETQWKYDIVRFAEKPPDTCYKEALSHQALRYSRVDQTEEAMLTALAQSNPIVIGFTVYQSFESDDVTETGLVPMPQPSERTLGGHAVLIVGYDRPKRLFTVRNSWGSKWGDHGHCYVPFDYFLDPDLASDLWIMQNVAGLTIAQQPAH
jgi:C1A family cysteine protease